MVQIAFSEQSCVCAIILYYCNSDGIIRITECRKETRGDTTRPRKRLEEWARASSSQTWPQTEAEGQKLHELRNRKSQEADGQSSQKIPQRAAAIRWRSKPKEEEPENNKKKKLKMRQQNCKAITLERRRKKSFHAQMQIHKYFKQEKRLPKAEVGAITWENVIEKWSEHHFKRAKIWVEILKNKLKLWLGTLLKL